MSFLEVSNITKKIGEETVLENVSLLQEQAQKIVIAGETGSGKSTLLKIIAGLEQPDSGQVVFQHTRVKGPAETLVPGHAQIAYLSQHFELPQFLRVEQVLEYANKISEDAAAELFRVCAIDHLSKRRTDELSGGERQRIALAKLLIGSPSLLLLDEPFTNLDMVQKNILKQVLIRLSDEFQMSIILVSHDPLDILPWADHIMIMELGKVVQSGSPVEIYECAKSEYVAGLLGKYNVVPTTVLRELFPDRKIKTQIGISRPEFVKLHRSSDPDFSGRVASVQFYGHYYEIEVRIARHPIFVRVPGNVKLPKKGEEVGVRFDKRKICFIDK